MLHFDQDLWEFINGMNKYSYGAEYSLIQGACNAHIPITS